MPKTRNSHFDEGTHWLRIVHSLYIFMFIFMILNLDEHFKSNLMFECVKRLDRLNCFSLRRYDNRFIHSVFFYQENLPHLPHLQIALIFQTRLGFTFPLNLYTCPVGGSSVSVGIGTISKN